MDLRADVDARAEGIVMDARVEKGMGVVADCIIRWGSIEKGDIIVSGTHMGKVKIIKDANNAQLKVGLPSQPVKISGFETVPKAGDPIVCVDSEAIAEELVRKRRAISSGEESDISTVSDAELQSAGKHMMSSEWKAVLEDKYNVHGDGNEGKIRIPVLVKADADGTLSAIRDSLVQLGESSTHNVLIDPVKTGIGPVLGTEIQLAKEFGAPIICFNVKNEQLIVNVAAEDGVKILQSDVIYTVLEDAKIEFTKFLPMEDVEIFHGRGKVKAIFDINGVDEKVAGVQVQEGKIIKGKVKSESGPLPCRFRVLRNGGVLVNDLEATSLKHFKTDVEEVTKGKDCGISLASHNDFEEGDVIECFSVEQRRPTF
jgi:translation initiation factor IF-2